MHRGSHLATGDTPLALAAPSASPCSLAGFRSRPALLGFLARLAILRVGLLHARSKGSPWFSRAARHQFLAHQTTQQDVDLVIKILEGIETGFLQEQSLIRLDAVSYTHLTLPTTPYV